MRQLDPELFPLYVGDSKYSYKRFEGDVELDLPSVWEHIVGNFFLECRDWVTSYQIHNVKTNTQGHKNNPSWSKDFWTPDYAVTLGYGYGDSHLERSKKVTALDFAEAYLKLLDENWTHCNNDSIDDPDACVVDTVVQYAMFGEVVY